MTDYQIVLLLGKTQKVVWSKGQFRCAAMSAGKLREICIPHFQQLSGRVLTIRDSGFQAWNSQNFKYWPPYGYHSYPDLSQNSQNKFYVLEDISKSLHCCAQDLSNDINYPTITDMYRIDIRVPGISCIGNKPLSCPKDISYSSSCPQNLKNRKGYKIYP